MKRWSIFITQKSKSDDGGELSIPGKELDCKNMKRKVSNLIPYLLSCPTHHILATKKLAEKNKSKKKFPSHTYDDFHAHLVVTSLKTQESTMHGKMTHPLSFINTEETYMLYKE